MLRTSLFALLLPAILWTGCGGGGGGQPVDGGRDAGADAEVDAPDGAGDGAAPGDFCAGRPRLAFWADEVRRIRALAAQDDVGPLGVSGAELYTGAVERARASRYTLDSVPMELPASKGAARAVADTLRQAVRQAGFLRHLEDDDRHAAFVHDAVLRVASWPDWGNNDLTLAAFTYAAAGALDWFCEDFTPEERQTVVAALRTQALTHYASLAADGRRPFTPDSSPNHKMSSAVSWGAAAIVLRGFEPQADDWLAAATELVASALATAGGPGGGAVEGPGYGGATPTFLSTFELDLRHAGGPDVAADAPWLTAFPAYIVQVIGPNATQVNFNDAGLDIADTYVPAALAAAYHAPADSPASRLAQGILARWVATSGSLPLPNPLLLRYVRPELAAAPITDWPKESTFPVVGQAFVRTGWGGNDHLFAFKAQPPGPEGVTSHIHHDAGHMILDWGGVRLLGDPGYAMQGFLAGQIPDDLLERMGCGTTTEAKLDTLNRFTLYEGGHNTLTIERADGERLPQRGWGAGLARAELASPHFYVATEMTEAYAPTEGAPSPVEVTRQVAGRLGAVLLVYDRVNSNVGPIRPQARFHALRSNPGSGEPPAPARVVPGTPAYLVPTSAGSAGRRLQVVATGSRATTLAEGRVPDLSCLGSFLVVTPEEAAENVELVTALVPEVEGSSPSPQVTVELRADRVEAEVRRGGSTVRVAIARDPRGIMVGGSRLVAAVTVDGEPTWSAPATP